jgi:hypothetical protein
MLQIQAKRDSRTSREENDSWLCMVLHEEPSPTSAEGNRMTTANQRICSPLRSRPGKGRDAGDPLDGQGRCAPGPPLTAGFWTINSQAGHRLLADL